MTKLKTAFCSNLDGKIDYVYSKTQQGKIAKISDLYPNVLTAKDLLSGDYKDLEVIFATWGMPVLQEEELGNLPNLKAIFYAAGATDGFHKRYSDHGVVICSAWQANAIPVAEYTLANILLGLKGFYFNSRELRRLKEWNEPFRGPGIFGEEVALLGAGAIAQDVAKLLANHDIKVTIIPSRKEKRTTSIEEVFKSAFVISNHLPDRSDNQGVLTGELFRTMRYGATFINTGRGAQIMEEELLDVLEERPDLTAIIDTPIEEPPYAESRLYTLDNVIFTTHIAGSMNDEVQRMAEFMIDEFERFEKNEKLLFKVEKEMLLSNK